VGTTGSDAGGASPVRRAALVTGCSSGIGYATAVRLARGGFTVFATVRKEADAERLRRLGEPDLVPVCPLDLACPGHIAPAVDAVAREIRARGLDGLYALVNNAGAGGVAPIELIGLDTLRAEVEARIVGPVALLQALLPLLRQGHGRVAWIATPALIPVPYVAGIHACDFAANCLARTAALELRPWRIPQIIVRCGAIRTPASGRSTRELSALLAACPPERAALYRDTLAKEAAGLAAIDAQRTDPAAVAEVVLAALTAARPRRRYRVGRLSALAAMVELLPQGAVDRLMAMRG